MRPDVLVLGGGGVLGEAWMRSCLAGLADATGWQPGDADHDAGDEAQRVLLQALVHDARALGTGGLDLEHAHGG